MGMQDGTPKLEVLNAGAGVLSVTLTIPVVYRFLSPAVQRLGGIVPQSAFGNHAEGMKLAYEALHERTGSQGRLRHVQCLVLGEWSQSPSLLSDPR